jgi:hypothetical protein
LDLVGGNPIRPRANSGGRTTVFVQQLGGALGVNPLRTMDCRRLVARDDAAAA